MKEMSRYLDTSIGSYRLTKLIGAGPVSCVYLAERQDRAESQVVLKLFEALPFASLEEKDQTLDEIRLLACLEHPSILPTLDDGLHENILYLVTPYIAAGSLRQRLTAAAGELLPLKETMALLRQIGDALQYAHTQQIVHANIKPENILFQRDGTVLLADFLLPSLVKSERAARIFSTFAAYYMAPEQFQGQATPLSDQYALACLAYELLIGQPPFEADNLMRLALKHATEVPQLPSRLQPRRVQHLDDVLLRAMAKRPQERYPDVQTFLAQLSAPPPLIAQVSTPDTSLDVVQSPETALDPVLSAMMAETVTPSRPAYPLSIAVFDQETIEQPISPQAYPLSVMGFEREPVDPAISLPAPPLPGAALEPEAAEQNSPLVLPALDAVDMHSAVTIMISPEAAGPAVGAGLPMNLVYAPSQQAILQARARSVARLSRSRILLLVGMVALVIVISLSGVIIILGASSTTRTQLPPPGGKVALLTPTTSSGQTQPGATSTTSATGIAAATATSTQPGATSTAGTAAGLSCQVDYKLSSSWPGGFVANLIITNTSSSAIQGWTLVFTFAGGERVTNGWNGRFTQNGTQVSIANAAYNASLAPGSTVAPGFQASSSGGNNTPAAFALNGVACK